MTKTIWHICGPQRNYGDQALVMSMRHRLQEQSSELLKFNNICVKKPKELDKNYIEYINLTGDLLLIGGGGLVMMGDGFETVSGWQVNISDSNIGKINIPIVVYAIGYNVFKNSSLPSVASKNLKLLQKKTSLFSVRDKGSRNAIVSSGLTEMEVIPDPACFVKTPEQETTELLGDIIDQDDLVIGFNWAGDRLYNRFPNWGAHRFIAEVSAALNKFLAKRKGKVVFIPHVSKYDLSVSKLFREYLGDNFVDISEIFPFMFPEEESFVPLLAEIYKRLDVAVVMRGHGAILAYSQGTPFIGLDTHNKIKFFADEVGGICIDSDGSKLFETLETVFSTSEYNCYTMPLEEADSISRNFDKRLLNLL